MNFLTLQFLKDYNKSLRLKFRIEKTNSHKLSIIQEKAEYILRIVDKYKGLHNRQDTNEWMRLKSKV